MAFDLDQAADHLAMVDRILARADEPVTVSGWPFVIWGAFGALADVFAQLVMVEQRPASLLWIPAAALAIVVGYMAFFVRGTRNRERSGHLDRYVNGLFALAGAVALVATLLGEQLFAGWAQAAVWSLVFGLTMMSCALLVRDRVLFAGGAVLIFALVAANLAPASVGYVLAAGSLAGMAGAGVVLISRRR
jgi:hypothetical protein